MRGQLGPYAVTVTSTGSHSHSPCFVQYAMAVNDMLFPVGVMWKMTSACPF